MEILQDFPCSLSLTIPSTIAPLLTQQLAGSKESNALYQLHGQDLELLAKFQTRTVFTITSDRNRRIYQDEMIKLACSVRAHVTHIQAMLTLTDSTPS
jgi:hypothetical protein